MERQEKLPNFIVCNTLSLVVSPEAPFNWKLLLIGIGSVKGIIKKSPILQEGEARPCLMFLTFPF